GLEPRETCADLASREIAFTDTTLWTEAPCGVARDRIVSNTGVKKHLGISPAELEAEIALRVRVGLGPHDAVTDALDDDAVRRDTPIGKPHFAGEIDRSLLNVRELRLILVLSGEI